MVDSELRGPSSAPLLPSAASAEWRVAACLRRRWTYILPAVFVTYSLAYLDRANYGFGAAGGMAATLHITGSQQSLLAALFFAGYFAFQIPGATLARKYSVRRVVSAALILWGSFAALTGVLRVFWMLAIDRLLLGVAESLIFPVMLHLLTRWFTRAERSRANALLMLGNPATVLWMSAITGYLIQHVGWQRTFIYEGLPSVAWGAIWFLFVRDKPSEAKWLTPEAAGSLERRLHADQAGIPAVGALRTALLRADTLLLSVQYFFWSLVVYGFVYWLPKSVHEGAAVSMTQTGFLTAIPYLVAIVLMILVAYVSDKMQLGARLIAPSLFLSGLALMGAYLLVARSFPLAFVCLVVAGGFMYAPYGPFFALVPDRLPRNVTAEAMALINSFGALGGFVGTYGVGLLQSHTGNPRAGFLLMSLTLVLSALLMLFLPSSQRSNNGAPQRIMGAR